MYIDQKSKAKNILSAASTKTTRKEQDLFSCHSCSAFWTFLLITRSPQLMGCFFTAVWANTTPTRSCRKTTSPALTTALTHASTCSLSLSCWTCSVASWHFICLLLFLVYRKKFLLLQISIPCTKFSHISLTALHPSERLSNSTMVLP